MSSLLTCTKPHLPSACSTAPLRPQAFLWAAVPGLMEPFGGLIGYLALHGDNDLAFAIVFGLVAGAAWGR